MGWASLRTPIIQAAITKKIIESVYLKTGSKIQIGKIRYGINNTLTLIDVLIPDQNNDTIVYIKKTKIRIKKLNISNKTINVSTIDIDNITANIEETQDNRYNFSFIIDSLRKNNTNNIKWNINCLAMTICNSNINYTTNNNEPLKIYDFDTKVRNISISKKNTKVSIPKLSLKTNIGLEIINLSTNFAKKENTLSLINIRLETLNSSISIDNYTYKKNPKNKNKFTHKISISPSFFNPSEFSYLNKHLKLLNQNIDIEGIYAITENTIFGKSCKSTFDDFLLLDANFTIPYKGNNNDSEISITKLNIKPDILYKKYHSLLDSLNINIPKALFKYGDISYSGKMNFSKNSISNNGIIKSNLGEINSISSIENINNRYIIDAKLQGKNINLSPITNNSIHAGLSLNMNTKGEYSKKTGINLNINGGISDIYYNEYNFDSIGIKGNIKNKTFSGRISSYDKRLRFDLNGIIDLDSLPKYNFETSVYTADLYSLGIKKFKPKSDISFNLNANFQGNDYTNFEGSLSLSNIFYAYDSSFFATDSIVITSGYTSGKRNIQLSSEFFNAKLQGDIYIISLIDGLKGYAHNYLPSVFDSSQHKDTISNFRFFAEAEYPQPITDLFFPELKLSSGSYIEGHYDATKNKLWSRVIISDFVYNNSRVEDLELFSENIDSLYLIRLTTSKYTYSDKNSLNNIELNTKIFNDNIESNFTWNNWLQHTYSGELSFDTKITKNNNSKHKKIGIDIKESDLIFYDTVWHLAHSNITIDSSGTYLNEIKLINETSLFSVDGKISNNPSDSISIGLKNININYVNELIKKDRLTLNGIVNGTFIIKDLYNEKHINTNLIIDDLSINNKIVGNTLLKSNWDNTKEQLSILGSVLENRDTTFHFNGYISPQRQEIDCNFIFNNLQLSFLEAFLNPALDKISGNGNGKIRVHGKFPSPSWNGYLYADFENIRLSPTNVKYNLKDTIYFKENKIIFNNATIHDKYGNTAVLSGDVSHSRFKYFYLNLRISTGKILGLNTNYTHHPRYNGVGFASGLVKLEGISSDLNVNIAATTLKNTYLNIPLEGKREITDNDFVVFKKPNLLNESSEIQEDKAETKVITNIRLDLTVTPDAQIQIIFDPQYGDYMRSTGNAEITMESKGSDFFMYGDYMIYNGDFMFTLQNIINKKLKIKQGSYISWSGNAENAQIDIDAVYKLRRVSLYDLTLDDDDKLNKIPVDCHLKMKDNLNSPKIKFEVGVPTTTNNEIVNQINSLPEDEVNKQVISLLLLNKFSPLPGLVQSSDKSTSENLGATTASELLSNQLSSWLSQMTSDFDMGIMYRPGDDVSEREVDLALSTSLWDDRLTINGNFGYNENKKNVINQNTNPYTTDFKVELKINRKGNIRLTAFNRVNNDYIYNTNVAYTQGIGIFYTDDFNTFDELMQKMFRKGAAVKPEEIKIIPDETEVLPE